MTIKHLAGGAQMLCGYPETTRARRHHLPHCGNDQTIGFAEPQPPRPTLSVQSVQQAFRRLDRHRAGRSPPAVVRLGVVSVLHGFDSEAVGTLVYTDEYSIYDHLEARGY